MCLSMSWSVLQGTSLNTAILCILSNSHNTPHCRSPSPHHLHHTGWHYSLAGFLCQASLNKHQRQEVLFCTLVWLRGALQRYLFLLQGSICQTQIWQEYRNLNCKFEEVLLLESVVFPGKQSLNDLLLTPIFSSWFLDSQSSVVQCVLKTNSCESRKFHSLLVLLLLVEDQRGQMCQKPGRLHDILYIS